MHSFNAMVVSFLNMEKDHQLAKHIFSFRRKIIHSVLAEVDAKRLREEDKEENVREDTEEEPISPKKLPEDISESKAPTLIAAEVRSYGSQLVLLSKILNFLVLLLNSKGFFKEIITYDELLDSLLQLTRSKNPYLSWLASRAIRCTLK